MVKKVNNKSFEILSLFTKGYDKEYYIREVERLVKISSRTALLALDDFEKSGILESKSRGKIKNYYIKKSSLSREFFILAEQYKKVRFFERNHLVREIFDKIDNFLDGLVIVFGSYAKGKEKKDSDLDLFIIGNCNNKKIKAVGKKYGIEINIKKYPMEIFEKEMNEDYLLKEILENHILIKNGENFVNKVVKWIR